MALQYRFYRSPVVPWTRPGSVAAKIFQYISNSEDGTVFVHHLLNKARPVDYSFVCCDETIHNTIEADLEIQAMSPRFADLPAVQAWLDGDWDSTPATAKLQFENDGISTAWTAPATTRRNFWRYLNRYHSITHDLARDKDPDLFELLKANLNLTVGTIPAAKRQKFANWMNRKGLSTTWITGTTTIRQVVQFVLENIDWPAPNLGEVKV